MFVILQNKDKKVWIECKSFSIRYYSYNDDHRSLRIGGSHFREGERWLNGCEDILQAEEGDIVVREGQSMLLEYRKQFDKDY